MLKIPVSVIIATRNEEKNIARCLRALEGFDEIIVVDSASTDKTCEIAQEMGTRVEQFVWDGKYPKKRQWILNNLKLSHDWVFWVDADEEVTSALKSELKTLFLNNVHNAGYFIRGRYVWRGEELHHGMMNNKIALIHKHKMEFPVVDDLHIEGMGEMEGHYQPVLKQGFSAARIGQVTEPLLHHAYDDEAAWEKRHERYARWEAEMTRKKSWPVDPVPWRERAKCLIRTSIFRPWIMFGYSYIWKLGFLDGVAGFEFARSRMRYCRMILNKL
jgi:glycosyltransferase involved in cell wall biosynthesis